VTAVPEKPDLPDTEIVAIVELVPGWEITAAGIGVWTGADDGIARLFLEIADFPMTPDVARVLADKLQQVADVADFGGEMPRR